MRRLSGSAVPCLLALVLLSSAALLSLTAWEAENGSSRGERVRVSLNLVLRQGSAPAAGTASTAESAPALPPPPPSPLRGLASANLATLGGSGVSCAVALPTPRVALLFLTVGPMPHEALWEAWLRSAGGLVPKASLAAKGAFCLKMCRKGKCVQRCGAEAACNPLCAAALSQQHGSKPGLPALAGQSLVSVFVHAPPAFPGYPPGSLFHGSLIRNRMETSWGTHSLAEAAKRLVEAAVAGADNRWFILASETTVPLYSAALFWAQLASERLSRINACPAYEQDAKDSRWSPYMLGNHFRYTHWRKSSQWWILQRRHAELVAGDEEVNAIFRRWCFDRRDEVLGEWRDCISDEHYVPSLLAMHGADRETDCRVNGGTAVDWSAGGMHPRTWWAADVREEGAELIGRIRRTELNCSFSEAVARAPAAFVDVTGLGAAGGARACARTLGSKKEWARSGSSFRGGALGRGCPLLVRKFAAASSEPLLQLYRDCSKGLGFLACPEEVG